MVGNWHTELVYILNNLLFGWFPLFFKHHMVWNDFFKIRKDKLLIRKIIGKLQRTRSPLKLKHTKSLGKSTYPIPSEIKKWKFPWRSPIDVTHKEGKDYTVHKERGVDHPRKMNVPLHQSSQGTTNKTQVHNKICVTIPTKIKEPMYKVTFNIRGAHQILLNKSKNLVQSYQETWLCKKRW